MSIELAGRRPLGRRWSETTIEKHKRLLNLRRLCFRDRRLTPLRVAQSGQQRFAFSEHN